MGYRDYKHPELLRLIKSERPQTIVELGSLYGNSAIAMAHAGHEADIKDFKIYCVDTWLGSIENWVRGNESKRGHSALMLDRTGRPQFYNHFIKKIRHAGVANCITPLSMTARTGIQYLHYCDIHPDLVYVDASHEYQDVMEDIEGALSITNTGGIVCGDDYRNKEGVTQAINELKQKYDINIEKIFWWMRA